MITRKRCFKCKIEKPLEDFTLHGPSKDGRHPRCRICRNTGDRAKYAKKPRVIECSKKRKERKQLLSQGMKLCSQCGKKKLFHAFGNKKNSKCGKRSTCKDCRRKDYEDNRSDDRMMRLAKEEIRVEEIKQLHLKSLRRCLKCKTVQPLVEFYKQPIGLLNLFARCKTCVQKSSRLSMQRPEAKLRAIKKAQHDRKLHPEKHAARNAIGHAITRGDMEPAKSFTCSNCERQANQYHHWSYEEEHWFDVTPLCGRCHYAVHHPTGGNDNED